jgi:hypothetical protein
MGKSDPGPQTVVNKTELPKWVEQAGQENYGLAKQLSGQLPGAYQGNMVAPISDMQQAGWDYAARNAGMQQPYMTAAQNTALGAANYAPEQVQAQSFLTGNLPGYMNPFTQMVLNPALEQLESQRLNQMNQIGDRAVSARAFGGSRQGVQEGVTNAAYGSQAAKLTADLFNQNYQQAQQAMAADQNRAMQAAMANQQAGLSANQQGIAGAATAGQLAGSAQAMGYKDAAALENIGQQQQGYQQQLLAQDAARFDANKAAMLEPLNLRLSALGMTPYGQTNTQTTTGGTTGGNPLMGALGGASAGASIFSALGGMAALGPFGFALPALGALAGGFGSSDEREKTDIKRAGSDKETGLPLYAYRYKGDPKTYPKVVGPMAQDIAQKFPDQVADIGGRLAVNLGFGPMRRAFKQEA